MQTLGSNIDTMTGNKVMIILRSNQEKKYVIYISTRKMELLQKIFFNCNHEMRHKGQVRIKVKI